MSAFNAADDRPAFPADVDIGVVSHNGRETLPRTLADLVAAGAPEDRITLFDIGSTDETAAWTAASWPRITVKRLADNVGPNPARNLAIASATRPYVLLVDADAYVRPGAPAQLRRVFEGSDRIGLAAPVVVHVTAPDRIQYAGGGLHFICEAVNEWAGRPLADRGAERRDIGAAPGITLLVDVAAARAVHGFDDRYFMGKEDGDFCHRLRIAGYRLVEDPRAVVEHGSGRRTTWMFPFQIRNRWHFLLRNYELRTLIVLFPALAIHEGLQFAVLLVQGHLGAWWKGLRGLMPWLKTLGADRRDIRSRRRCHDRDLLLCAPLIVRKDLAGGRAGGLAKRAYDAWLRGYWRVARGLLA